MRTRQGVAVGTAAAALGVLLAQPLAGAATILPQHAGGPAVQRQSAVSPQASVPEVPQLTTPSTTMPSATVPTTPAGTTSSVTPPPATTPRVSTPVATVPSVTTPSVSAASGAAAVRTTASRVSALVGGATHSAQASGAPGDPASAAPDKASAVSGATGRVLAEAPATGGLNAASTPGAATTRGAASAAHAAFARGRRGAPAHRSGRTRRVAAARESRRLRHLVARLHGCLGTLGVGARRLLSLRAGLHGPARSAAATARILHVSTRRETRLERRALGALQRTATRRCAGPAPASAPGLAAANAASAAAPSLSASTAPPGPAASLSAAHAERGPAGGRRLMPTARARRAVERAETGSSFPTLLIPTLLALLITLALLALPETRRRLRLAGAAPPPAGAEPDAARRTDQPRPLSRRMGPRHTPMDAAMAQMATDVFAAMAGDAPAAESHSRPEGNGSDSQAQIEDEPAGE